LAEGIKERVEVRVIEDFKRFRKGVFNGPEIDTDSQFVKNFAPYDGAHDPVMTMDVFTGAFIIA
jgi:hypothetical protein